MDLHIPSSPPEEGRDRKNARSILSNPSVRKDTKSRNRASGVQTEENKGSGPLGYESSYGSKGKKVQF